MSIRTHKDAQLSKIYFVKIVDVKGSKWKFLKPLMINILNSYITKFSRKLLTRSNCNLSNAIIWD